MNQNKIISKLLNKSQNKTQWFAGIIGTYLGVTILILCIQLYLEINSVKQQTQNELGNKFIIVHKKVSALNTLNNKTNHFTSKDITQINEIEGVEKIGFFLSNKFQVWGSLSVNGERTNLGTELFFESLEDDFLDITPKDWKWNKNSGVIPLILPADFVNLYNFSFAPSRNLPPLSKKTIQLATFDLYLRGTLKNERYKGKIVGFSDRINSVLVPLDFLQYMNNHLNADDNFKKDNKKKIIVKCRQGETDGLFRLIQKKKWEVNKDKISDGKFASIVRLILIVAALFGFVIIFIAITTMILYLVLTLEKSKNEINTLLLIGVSRKEIQYFYLKKSIFNYLIIGCLGISSLLVIKYNLKMIATTYGVELSSGINTITYFALIILLAILLLIQKIKLREIGK